MIKPSRHRGWRGRAGSRPPGQQAGSAAQAGPGTCGGGARPPRSGWLAFWIIHGLRVLKINKMNDNKKLIKNFRNCCQVHLTGDGQPSSPSRKVGGSVGRGAVREEPRNWSGRALLGLRELFWRRPRGTASSPPAAAVCSSLGSPAWLRTPGRAGWRVRFKPPAEQIGTEFEPGGDPPSRDPCRVFAHPVETPTHPRQARGESQRPKSASCGSATAARPACAPPPPAPRLPAAGGRSSSRTAGQPPGSWPGPAIAQAAQDRSGSTARGPGVPRVRRGGHQGADRGERAQPAHARCVRGVSKERWAGVPQPVIRHSRRSSRTL